MFMVGVAVPYSYGRRESEGQSPAGMLRHAAVRSILLIAIAIAVHNIPEGLAISLVLVPRGASVRSAAGWSIFSSLPQPLLAVPAYLFVEAFVGTLPAALGFAAGAMVTWSWPSWCRRPSGRPGRLLLVTGIVSCGHGAPPGACSDPRRGRKSLPRV
jgi:zinc transporter ZupT